MNEYLSVIINNSNHRETWVREQKEKLGLEYFEGEQIMKVIKEEIVKLNDGLLPKTLEVQEHKIHMESIDPITLNEEVRALQKEITNLFNKIHQNVSTGKFDLETVVIITTHDQKRKELEELKIQAETNKNDYKEAENKYLSSYKSLQGMVREIKTLTAITSKKLNSILRGF